MSEACVEVEERITQAIAIGTLHERKNASRNKMAQEFCAPVDR